MGILYGNLNVDEKYSPILEPNLFYDSIFVPGVTYTDKYEVGPAGGIYVHKLATSAVEPGTPGRDFSDESTSDNLIQIKINNNYQKSKKIYGVQASAVSIDLANEQLSLAVKEVKESWNQSALACLVKEGTTGSVTSTITDARAALLSERTSIVKAKGKPDVVLCSPDFYEMLLSEVGGKFTPVRNDEIAATGSIGEYYGMTIIEASGLSAANAKYWGNTGSAANTVSFSNIAFVMYNKEALSIVNNLEAMRIVDSENFVGSKAQVEMNSGFVVTNPALVRIRKSTAG